jgi:glutathione peroxidase
MASKLYEIQVTRIDGTPVSLSEYQGKVLLIVNVASKCGLTPQYDGLEKLYEAYAARGLEVLGFPANEFAGQEPGGNQEIQDFCRLNFGVKFPMFEKIVVKGPGRHPLYDHLTTALPESRGKGRKRMTAMLTLSGMGPKQKGDILWNFEKFVVSRDGEVIARFAPTVEPTAPDLVAVLERALATNDAASGQA